MYKISYFHITLSNVDYWNIKSYFFFPFKTGVKTQGKENKTPIREDSIPEENVEPTLPEQPNFLTKTACPNTPVSTSNDVIKPKNGECMMFVY